MDPTLLQLAKLLPRLEDVESLLDNEVEARYILKKAIGFMENCESFKGEDEEEIRYLICALVDRNWERIHTGHFSSVPLNIRKIYAIGCYFKVRIHKLY